MRKPRKPIARRTPLKRSQKALKRTALRKPTLADLLEKGKVQYGSTVRRSTKPIRKRSKKKPGQQTQVELFREIFAERPHVSEISGLPLVEMPEDARDEKGMKAWLSQFSHLLPKGTYRRMKSNKRNIVLKTKVEHDLWGKYGPHWIRMNINKLPPTTREGWRMCCALYYELRDIANGLREGPTLGGEPTSLNQATDHAS